MNSNDTPKRTSKMSARQKWKKTLKRKIKRIYMATGVMPENIIMKNKPNDNTTNNKRTKKRKYKLKKPQEATKIFKREKLVLFHKYNRRKKQLLELQSTEQIDFVDYEGMIKLQEKIYAYEKEELNRRKIIYKMEMQLHRRYADLNIPYSLVLLQEGHLRDLIEANEKQNDEFQKEISEEKNRLLQRTELSRARRLELEQKAWENNMRNVALQLAEERAKTAELMVLLEKVCGHPAEETGQAEDDDGLEEILSSEDDCDMEDLDMLEECGHPAEEAGQAEDDDGLEEILSSEDEK